MSQPKSLRETYFDPDYKELKYINEDTTVEFEGQVLNVLERAIVDGYEDVKDADFDGIREMAKRTNMPPYQRF